MEETLGVRAERHIRAAARATGLESRVPEILELLRATNGHWWSRTVAVRYPAPGVTADGSPLEISLPVDVRSGDEPELRIGYEPQAVEPSYAANWPIALEMLEPLTSFGADVSRLHAILPLVEPIAGFTPPLGLGFGAAFRGDRPPAFRAYLSLDAAFERGNTVVDVGETLGARSAARELSDALGGAGYAGMLSLDLVGGAEARTKFYVVHLPERQAAYQSVEAVGALGAAYVPGDATEMLEAIAPLKAGEVLPVAVCTTVHAVGERIRGTSFNLRLMNGRALSTSSKMLTDRVAELIERHGGDSTMLRRIAPQFGGTDPESYDDYTFISLQREGSRRRTVAYYSPKLYDRAGPAA